MSTAHLQESEYGSYYKGYIDLVEELDVLDALDGGLNKTIKLFNKIPPNKYDYNYAEGKWTVKEVLTHIIDTERIFCYRALRFAREDYTELPGFDQDTYVVAAKANQRSYSALVKEYKTLRAATKSMFKSFDQATLARIGTASGNPFSVRALGYMIVGHETHHRNILMERYLVEEVES